MARTGTTPTGGADGHDDRPGASMVALVPVYQPGNRLLRLITELRRAAPDVRVVVVDDGSAPAAVPVLDGAADLGCTVLRHPRNLGKGVALRTGLRHVADTHPGHDVVGADADGQHAVADILRVAARVRATGALTLGVRRFDGEVPLRSRLGNGLTGLLFRAATGRDVRDTQTGLRGYPAGELGWLLSVPGDRFEYEMNVLLHAVRSGRPVEEVVVATRYLDDNASSHFGPLTDSLRVYQPLLRYAVSARRRRPDRR